MAGWVNARLVFCYTYVMNQNNQINIYFILSGLFILAISAVLGWLFNSVVYSVAKDGTLLVVVTFFGFVIWFVPVTLLNQYGIKVLKGQAKYFTELNTQMLKFTTFILFVVGALISLIFFAGKFMEGFSSGISEGSAIGYIVVMLISYASVFLIDFFKKHPLKTD